ncbi:MAG: M15 family metallopeptidase [Bacteroidetes bacterium]|nr:M15 family metallopeptidase [Bacteroidota bacterium]
MIAIFVLLLVSCHQHLQKENPYNLKIISNVSDYKKLISINPEETLVDIEKLIPGIILDIRYATKNNFTNQQIYSSPKAFVRKPVAEALLKIHTALNSKGLGLKVFDAYRPYSATMKFYEIYPDTNFVAAPWKGSVHNRGCAVDLTLIDLNTNTELEMPTLFDDFTTKSAHSFLNLSETVLKNRELLRDVMTKYGFAQYEYEWWHYDFVGWQNSDLMDILFEEL